MSMNPKSSQQRKEELKEFNCVTRTDQIVPFQFARVTECFHLVLILELNKKQRKNTLLKKNLWLELSFEREQVLSCLSALCPLWDRTHPPGWPVILGVKTFLQAPPCPSASLSPSNPHSHLGLSCGRTKHFLVSVLLYPPRGLHLFYFHLFHHLHQSPLPLPY